MVMRNRLRHRELLVAITFMAMAAQILCTAMRKTLEVTPVAVDDIWGGSGNDSIYATPSP